MTPLEDKLAEARAARLDFQSAHPRAKEDVAEGAAAWLADARRVTRLDVAGYIAGGGSLHHEHLNAAVTAFVVDSDAFASWMTAGIESAQLLPRKKRDAELKRLAKAVKDAETAIVREQLEAEKTAAEVKLAALERDEAA
jgi:hypothetical protein